MKPFFKSPGGKTKLLPELLKRVYRKKIDLYVEPFVGGGALFFELARQERFKRAIISDANRNLIALYCEVSRNLYRLIREASALESDFKKSKDRKAFYYRVRESDESPARTLFLNKTCFNGIWRVNKSGQFNVPFGDYANPTIVDRDVLVAASKALRAVDIHCGNFTVVAPYMQELLDRGRRVFCYCDPPYDCEFVNYTADGFDYESQVWLAHWPYWNMVSNADTPRMRKLYRRAARTAVIETVAAPRSVNSKGDGRGNVFELLVTR